MQTKELLNKEDVIIGDEKYFISSIPATKCQAMLFKAFSAFSLGNISAIPPELITELLSYCGTYNKAGSEVQFVDNETVDMCVTDPTVLLELESMMVEKNFSFLADGRLSKVVERLNRVFSQTSAS